MQAAEPHGCHRRDAIHQRRCRPQDPAAGDVRRATASATPPRINALEISIELGFTKLNGSEDGGSQLLTVQAHQGSAGTASSPDEEPALHVNVHEIELTREQAMREESARLLDGLLGLLAGDLEDAEADDRHLHVVVQRDGRDGCRAG